MESTTNNKSQALAHRRRPSLNWIDFLVIAAIILTFAAVVSSTLGRARASSHNSHSTSYSTDVGQAHNDPGT